MSKVKAYTPSWLSKPAPGHALFQATSEDIRTSVFSSKRTARPGPRRTIAKRGSEVYVAVNREMRWGDLVYLKQAWEEKSGGTRIKREDSTSNFSIYDEAQPSVESGDGYRVSGNHAMCYPLSTDAVADPQDTSGRRDPTACDLAELELPRRSHDTYCAHLCSSRFFASNHRRL